MLLRDPEVIRTALVATALVQARTVGYEKALRSLLVQQFTMMTDDELELVARELEI